MTDKMTGLVLPPVTMNVVDSGEGLVAGATIVTPADQPNIVVRKIPKLTALAARAAHLFVITFSTLVIAGIGTDIIPYRDFLDLLWKGTQLSLMAAFVAFMKDLPTITSQWAKDNPLLSGEV